MAGCWLPGCSCPAGEEQDNTVVSGSSAPLINTCPCHNFFLGFALCWGFHGLKWSLGLEQKDCPVPKHGEAGIVSRSKCQAGDVVL